MTLETPYLAADWSTILRRRSLEPYMPGIIKSELEIQFCRHNDTHTEVVFIQTFVEALQRRGSEPRRAPRSALIMETVIIS
jgi:hypothetical protein